MPNSIIDLGSALLNIQSEAEYIELKETHSTQLFTDTWESLTDESQNHINEVIKNNPISENIKPIIEDIVNAQTLEKLKEIKSKHSRLLISKAWEQIELNYPQEVIRIKKLSGQQTAIQPKPDPESTPYQLEKTINEIREELVGIIDKANKLNNRLLSLSNQLSNIS